MINALLHPHKKTLIIIPRSRARKNYDQKNPPLTYFRRPKILHSAEKTCFLGEIVKTKLFSGRQIFMMGIGGKMNAVSKGTDDTVRDNDRTIIFCGIVQEK